MPLDGIVVWGAAAVSMQHISGESAPVSVAPGSSVPAGSLSTDGLLVLRVSARREDSMPARIARMAMQAQVCVCVGGGGVLVLSHALPPPDICPTPPDIWAPPQVAKPKLQRIFLLYSDLWSKAVIAATLATVLLLPLFGVPLGGPHGALYRAMGVLTAGSPCAIALIPLAYVCALACITRKGVLVKAADSLDALARCSHLMIDKTGRRQGGGGGRGGHIELTGRGGRLDEAGRPASHQVRSSLSPTGTSSITPGSVTLTLTLPHTTGTITSGSLTLTTAELFCATPTPEEAPWRQLYPLPARGPDLPSSSSSSISSSSSSSISSSPGGEFSTSSSSISSSPGGEFSTGSSSSSPNREEPGVVSRSRRSSSSSSSGLTEGSEAAASSLDVDVLRPRDVSVLLPYAVALSRASNHPVSRAMAKWGEQQERAAAAAEGRGAALVQVRRGGVSCGWGAALVQVRRGGVSCGWGAALVQVRRGGVSCGWGAALVLVGGGPLCQHSVVHGVVWVGGSSASTVWCVEWCGGGGQLLAPCGAALGG